MTDADFHKVIAVHSMLCTLGAVFCAWGGWRAIQVKERLLATLMTCVAIGLAAFAIHVQ